MKKAALLFIAALIITASIDFIWPFTTERADEDAFEQDLNIAEMLTYQDPDLGFTVRYPSFFAVQPDSLMLDAQRKGHKKKRAISNNISYITK